MGENWCIPGLSRNQKPTMNSPYRAIAIPSNNLNPSAVSRAGILPWGNLAKNSGFLLSVICAYSAGSSRGTPPRAPAARIYRDHKEIASKRNLQAEATYNFSCDLNRDGPECVRHFAVSTTNGKKREEDVKFLVSHDNQISHSQITSRVIDHLHSRLTRSITTMTTLPLANMPSAKKPHHPRAMY